MADKKVSKSKKLHKYENVYKKYVKEQQKTKKAPTKSPKKAPTKSPKKAPVKSPKKSTYKVTKKAPTKSPKKAPVKSPKKAPVKSPKKAPVKSPHTLNKYQLFVQNENTKVKYKGLCPKERMNLISKEWSKNKNCL